jgi:dipeptidyl aminopeptidase/acylaminoacyl peptidase
MARAFSVLLAALAAAAASAQTPYKLPPAEIVAAIDAAQPPSIWVSPRGDATLLLAPEPYPPIAALAEPVLRLGGVRIAPTIRARQRLSSFTAISILSLDGAAARQVSLPAGSRIGNPVWSPDGKRFAFTRDLADGVELWVGDVATAVAKAIHGLRVNDVLGDPLEWLEGSRGLLVRTVPATRGAAPKAPAVPVGPVIEETAGKTSQMPTFQDLLRTELDADIFEHFARAQLAVVDAAFGAVTPLGAPGLYTSVEPSPSGSYLLVTRLKRPFSARVPYLYFARATEVWDKVGRRVATVADLPVSDEVPRQGVPTGPRRLMWQPLAEAVLVWAEALDGGDPMRKVPRRDRLMSLEAPFTGSPREVLTLRHRLSGVVWTARRDVALVTERDRDRRWTTTLLVDLRAPSAAKILFDLSSNDAYSDPGDPVIEVRPTGERVALQDGDAIYLEGQGASENGDRPFLDRLNLSTLAKQRLFRCDESSHERFLGFAGSGRGSILTRRETKTDPPNLYLVDLTTRERRQLTAYQDPTPRLTRMKKDLVRYQRRDGVPLSATLYLPADHVPGRRLPALVWAYPNEYSDPATAGQVRGTPNAFPRLVGPSPLFLVTQGYAVLMDATMPVVGDPETVNDTYVEQISDAARAAVDLLDARGVADRRRILVAGHSYGAFMTANLLAHTDLFAAGIARSGAYNRTLTPFGFQSERRSFWEAPQLYMKVSPFSHANTINEPILLIHGEADNNSGTFPVQSERLFEAIRGNGGTARLVILPHESHGYRARESVLHTLAEMIEWADRHAKNRPAEGAAAAGPSGH